MTAGPVAIPIPNQCSPQVQSEYQLVSGVADPFAIDYKPLYRGGAARVNTGIDFGFGPGVIARDIPPQDGTFGVTPQAAGVSPVAGVGNINSGSPLLSLPPIKSVEWWHLTIWAQEIIRAFDINPDFSGQSAVRAARQVSMLKARVTWTEFPAIPRQIIIDIGTGIDIFIGPTNQLFSVEIMVPDPTSAPPVRPEGFTSSAPGNPEDPSVDPPIFRFDSYVAASAWCVYGSIGRPAGRFTQTAGTTSGAPNQPFVDIPIPDNARTVQVFSTEAMGNLPVIWGFENPVTPLSGGSSPPPVINTPLGQFDFFFGDHTGRVEVPQNAKFMRVSRLGATVTTFTAVFEDQQ